MARFPDGKDPGDLAKSDPEALAAAVADAVPFLGFRVNRVVTGRPLRTPEDRARVAAQAMAVINEHPDVNVRKLYAGEVAARVGLPVADLTRQAERRRVDEFVPAPVARTTGITDNAEFAAIAVLLQSWDEIAPWLVEDLFANDAACRAFLVLAAASEKESGTLLDNALAAADPEVGELLERAAVADIDVDGASLARDLLAVAVRRTLSHRVHITDPVQIREDREARLQLEQLGDPRSALPAAESLLGWIASRGIQSGG